MSLRSAQCMMVRFRLLLGFLFLTAVGVGGCVLPPAPIVSHGGPVADYVSFVDALRAAGATVEPAGTFTSPFFSGEPLLIRVDGYDVQVYEYIDPATAAAEAAYLSADGGEIAVPGGPVSLVEWNATPHFFRTGRLIVQFIGDIPQILALLESVLGPQFAGGPGPGNGESLGEPALHAPQSFLEAVTRAQLIVVADVVAARQGPDYYGLAGGSARYPTQRVELEIVHVYHGEGTRGDRLTLYQDSPGVEHSDFVGSNAFYQPGERYLLLLEPLELSEEVKQWQPEAWQEGMVVPLPHGRLMVMPDDTVTSFVTDPAGRAAPEETPGVALEHVEMMIAAVLGGDPGVPSRVFPPEGIAIDMPQGMGLQWRRSPQWTGRRAGPRDASGQGWSSPAFDEAEWTSIALPDLGQADRPDDRYYRGHFSWDGLSRLTLHFAADDGLVIYINGHLLGEWGYGWRQEGCVNLSNFCGLSQTVPPQTIPASMLLPGDNVIALDLWNGACCDSILAVAVVQEKGLPEGDEEAPVNPLASVELVLQTPLPTDLAPPPLLRRAPSSAPTVADVRQMAARYGLAGELYHEVAPGAEESGDGGKAMAQPAIYFALAGPRQFFYSHFNDEINIAYTDRQVPLSHHPATFLPLEKAAPIVEAFLNRGDLLDFPYEIASGSGDEVQFLRRVNGHLVITRPEVSAYVDRSGLVFAVSHFPLHSLVPLDGFAGLSAADAWQLVPRGAPDQVIHFITPANRSPVAAPSTQRNSLWHRTYRDGEQASLYGYTALYRPVEGSGPPRIRVDWFWLEGVDAELQALAAAAQQFVHVWGTVRIEEGTSWSLALAGWETVSGPATDYHSLSGTIRRADGQTLLHSDGGKTLQLAGAPSDLAAGDRVNVHGPAVEATDGPYPLFQWQRIESAWALAANTDGLEAQPPPVSRVVIDAVDRVYLYWPAQHTGFTSGNGTPLHLALPAWRFTGTTNSGDRIDIVVQAVADEEIRARLDR